MEGQFDDEEGFVIERNQTMEISLKLQK